MCPNGGVVICHMHFCRVKVDHGLLCRTYHVRSCLVVFQEPPFAKFGGQNLEPDSREGGRDTGVGRSSSI
jgi:hypothetical protein